MPHLWMEMIPIKDGPTQYSTRWQVCLKLRACQRGARMIDGQRLCGAVLLIGQTS